MGVGETFSFCFIIKFTLILIKEKKYYVKPSLLLGGVKGLFKVSRFFKYYFLHLSYLLKTPKIS